MSKEKPRKRIKINARYMQVRQRSAKKGKKGRQNSPERARVQPYLKFG